jgi:hypothetical protein
MDAYLDSRNPLANGTVTGRIVSDVAAPRSYVVALFSGLTLCGQPDIKKIKSYALFYQCGACAGGSMVGWLR